EKEYLSPFAVQSACSKGRLYPEEPCPMRTDFQRDRDRIIYSKAFIRLKNKTQVFFSPEGDHYRTRLTHTLDVSQVARSIARMLSLNEDLAEAIALGHDLGHTPFGHAGERCLDKLSSKGFRHNEQSLRVVDVLEKDGKGLNLTFEVRDGIVNHKMSLTPSTLEGQAVSLADRISYISHDIDDAVRAGIITTEMLPKDAIGVLGLTTGERINKTIGSIFNASIGKNYVKMEENVSEALSELRAFMFENVYLNENAKKEEETALRMLTALFDYFMKNPEKLPYNFVNLLNRFDREVVVCDYLSSMTDRYAVYIFENIFIPKNFYVR
ncbi:MAG: deoxyguanosinetriphosphate triphosphohydrolase, partial [Clostridia bacterium]|nr:deoxyguanosinetriphosphate triphosphohydrolase [Clostridia bacterium]